MICHPVISNSVTQSCFAYSLYYSAQLCPSQLLWARELKWMTFHCFFISRETTIIKSYKKISEFRILVLITLSYIINQAADGLPTHTLKGIQTHPHSVLMLWHVLSGFLDVMVKLMLIYSRRRMAALDGCRTRTVLIYQTHTTHTHN